MYTFVLSGVQLWRKGLLLGTYYCIHEEASCLLSGLIQSGQRQLSLWQLERLIVDHNDLRFGTHRVQSGRTLARAVPSACPLARPLQSPVRAASSPAGSVLVLLPGSSLCPFHIIGLVLLRSAPLSPSLSAPHVIGPPQHSRGRSLVVRQILREDR